MSPGGGFFLGHGHLPAGDGPWLNMPTLSMEMRGIHEGLSGIRTLSVAAKPIISVLIEFLTGKKRYEVDNEKPPPSS